MDMDTLGLHMCELFHVRNMALARAGSQLAWSRMWDVQATTPTLPTICAQARKELPTLAAKKHAQTGSPARPAHASIRIGHLWHAHNNAHTRRGPIAYLVPRACMPQHHTIEAHDLHACPCDLTEHPHTYKAWFAWHQCATHVRPTFCQLGSLFFIPRLHKFPMWFR